jgi:hypothetical protein
MFTKFQCNNTNFVGKITHHHYVFFTSYKVVLVILIILTQPSKKEEFESIGTMFLFAFLKQHRIQTYFSLNMLEYFFNISEDLKISINFLSMRMYILYFTTPMMILTFFRWLVALTQDVIYLNWNNQLRADFHSCNDLRHQTCLEQILKFQIIIISTIIIRTKVCISSKASPTTWPCYIKNS